MNKKYIVLLIVLVLILLIVLVCIKITSTDIGYIPPLNVVGDVKQSYTLRGSEGDFDIVDIEMKDRKIKGVKLEDILLKAQPLNKKNDILLVGIDGMISKIGATNLQGSYISFTDKNGWEAIHYNHPASSNVKHLKEIVIVAKEDRMDIGMNIIDSEKNIKNITVGELYASTSTILPYFEGESSIKKKGQKYSASVYTQRRIFRLEDMVEENLENALVMGALGEIKPIEEDGYFEVNANSIDYVSEDGKGRIEDVKGVIINPPNVGITDSYYDISHYLEEEEDVLFLLLDGFGYHQYQYAIENGYLSFLRNQPEGTKALSVYKPVTNAGLAAILTGKSPAENGVYSRKQRELQTDSIFKMVEDFGKKAIYIEGNIGILNTEIEPVLNMDNDGDGFTDDEVFQSTLNALDKEYNLVFTHFHGIDDAGHSHGDLSSETMEVIAKIDTYVEELVSNWDGKVIITADHGMHSTEKAGDHGQFRYENMIVPYIIIDGGGDI